MRVIFYRHGVMMKKGDLVKLSMLYAQGPGIRDQRIGIVIDIKPVRLDFHVDVMWPPAARLGEHHDRFGTYNPIELESINE